MVGGMHGRGHVRWGGCGRGGGMCGGGMCGGGHAWQEGAWQGGMHGRGVHGRGHACHSRYYGIRSMSRQYASYWNAFLSTWFSTHLEIFNTVSNAVFNMVYNISEFQKCTFPDKLDWTPITSKPWLIFRDQNCFEEDISVVYI